MTDYGTTKHMNEPNKPIAWLHILDNTENITGNKPMRKLTFGEENPFGIPGKDYSNEFQVKSIPLIEKING